MVKVSGLLLPIVGHVEVRDHVRRHWNGERMLWGINEIVGIGGSPLCGVCGCQFGPGVFREDILGRGW